MTNALTIPTAEILKQEKHEIIQELIDEWDFRYGKRIDKDYVLRILIVCQPSCDSRQCGERSNSCYY